MTGVIRGSRSPASHRKPARSRPPPGLEADAMLVGLDADVDDLFEVQAHAAVERLDVVPAAFAALERGLEFVEVLLRDAQPEWRRGFEADDDPGCYGHVQCPSAGWTSSVSTPPVAAGCMKATIEPRIPRRATSS